jgi:hypothetical protein
MTVNVYIMGLKDVTPYSLVDTWWPLEGSILPSSAWCTWCVVGGYVSCSLKMEGVLMFGFSDGSR